MSKKILEVEGSAIKEIRYKNSGARYTSMSMQI